MPPGLQVPTVTQEDLQTFHARVFEDSNAQQPAYDDVSAVHDEWQDKYGEEEEDGLGYYPDGKKRTLTDEQIAMFRHSEIYAIIRERQVQKENEEAEGLDRRNSSSILQSSPLADGEVLASAADSVIQSKTASRQSSEPGISASVGLKPAGVQNDDQGTKNSLIAAAVPDGISKSLKRKRNTLNDDGNNERSLSSRRTIRELDSVVSAEMVLNYGDDEEENAPKVDPSLAQPEPQQNTVKGRKIWWPVIEG